MVLTRGFRLPMKLYVPASSVQTPLVGPAQLAGLLVTIVALHLCARYSFLLFHTLVESIRIFVLGGMFVLAWHSRRWSGNAFLSVIGIAAVFIAGLELLHTLGYKGVGILKGFDANLPTQLWIAFRYLESLSFLLAAGVAHRRVNGRVLIGGYAAITAVLIAAVLTGVFPDCYVEEQGLTAFKIGSEYVIAGIFVASLLVLYGQRSHFDNAVLATIMASIVLGILAELAFTQYVSVFGAANEYGHYLLLASAYFLYRAVLVTGIVAPYDLLFRNLKQKEAELESKVIERTAALRKSQALSTAFAENSPSAIYMTDRDFRYTLVNTAFERLAGRPRAGIIGRNAFEVFPAPYAQRIDDYNQQVIRERTVVMGTDKLRVGDDERVFEAVRFPIVDDHGELVGVGGVATDVTDFRMAEERYGTIIRASMDAFVILDWAGRFTEVNDAACELSGYSRVQMLEMGVGELEAALDAAAIRARLEAVAAAGAGRFDSRWRRQDGGFCDIEVSINYIDGAMGARFFAFVRDITERKAAVARIEFLAHHDVLTGLPNKLLFQERFLQVAAYAEREGRRCALLYLDLDNFKVINDSLGHVAGDALLKRTAGRLTACMRETDAVCRVGGDEFLVLLADAGDTGAITAAIGKVLQQLAAPMEIDHHELVTTVSLGAAVFPEDGRDFDTLFKKADTAMFQAKAAGRNAHRFFDEGMNANALERLALLGRLRGAVERKELVLHYQPQIDLASGEVTGAEALIRWRHPEQGEISPARFIPLAEDSGLIVQIGAWVLEEACRQAARWQQAGLPEIVVAVNLSAVQFRSPELYQTVADALAAAGLDAEYLELELTESILLGDVDSVLESVQRFKRLGLRLSIDDFGTGYSSLSYLKRFAVDKLKIDQSFVREMDKNPDDAALVQAIIQMARSLGLKTIAEGVEHEHLVERLRSYACDEAQGYHFGRPMPADAFAAYLAEHSTRATA